MEFNEKLQELRRRKNLTQEELAQALYVSRAAISKWESGRGLPNIESLKEISKFFAVSLDDLLSGDELLVIAEDDQKQREAHTRNKIFGLLDCSMAALFFLPFFGQEVNGVLHSVQLLAVTALQTWLRVSFYIVVISMVMVGILEMAWSGKEKETAWGRHKTGISLGVHIIGAFLFIVSRQPYAAAFAFLFLIIKLFLFAKRP